MTDSVKSDEQRIRASRMQEQCFLIHNFEAFAESNQSEVFSNFVPIHGNPTEIVQKLLSIPDLAQIMSIRPYLMSSLVPQIKLYKVHYPSADSKGVSVEIPFEDHLNPTSIDDITKSGYSRGMGAGLVSFEWELLGTNPAESDNNIKAKLKLHFNSLEDLIATRGSHEGQDISYVNLVEPTSKFLNDGAGGTKTSEGTRSWNSKYFAVKVSCGYGEPTGAIWDENPDMANAIRNARQIFTLGIIGHSLEFKEGGAVDLEIEYLAYAEGALSHKNADVMLIGRTDALEQREAERRKERESAAKKVSDENSNNKCLKKDDRVDDAKEEQKDLLEDQKEDEAEDKYILYSSLINALEETGRIYSIKLKPEHIGIVKGEQFKGDSAAAARAEGSVSINKEWVMGNRTISKGGSLDNLIGAAKSAKDPEDRADVVKDFNNSEATAPEPDELEVFYFHYGDLLNVALRCLYETGTPQLERIKVITGPYVYSSPKSGQLLDQYNIADIPISLNLFQVWFMNKVIKPQIEKYTLKSFIKDSITGLVGAAMQPECFGKDYGSAPAHLSLQMLQVPSAESDKCRVTGIATQGKIGNKRVMSLADILPYPAAVKAENAETYSYVFMFVSANGAKIFSPPQDGEGTREARDSKLGTYHFRIGADGGLMKKIKFNKTDQPYAREARMQTEGDQGLAFLREVYNADIEMFGNAIFRPGMHIYVDPSSVGLGDPSKIRSIASKMGLGGYFLVTNVKCAIEAGKFQTDLKTIWVNSGSGKAENTKQNEDCKDDDGMTGTPSAGTGALPSTAPSVSEKT